jgi:hypothetical protein
MREINRNSKVIIQNSKPTSTLHQLSINNKQLIRMFAYDFNININININTNTFYIYFYFNYFSLDGFISN